MDLSYVIVFAIIFVVSVAGKFFSNVGMDWYDTLAKPSITPPRWMFGMVWPIIFLFSGIAAIAVWKTFARDGVFWTIIILFLANAVLNLSWSYLFFYKRLIFASLICSIVLTLVTYALIFLITQQSFVIASLLFLYVVWITFATYLDFLFWALNKNR